MSRDRSWNDGDKLSFSERDKRRRDGSGDSNRPKGVSKAQEQQAKRQYLKKIDGMFSTGGAEVEKLAAAVASAHGGPGLVDACRAYRDAAGYPNTPRLIGMFLDSDDAELISGTLEAVLALCESAGFELTSGLRTQIRMLVDGRDYQIATLAEDLLEKL